MIMSTTWTITAAQSVTARDWSAPLKLAKKKVAEYPGCVPWELFMAAMGQQMIKRDSKYFHDMQMVPKMKIES